LFAINDGEPAYDIGVYPAEVCLGDSTLQFTNTITRLTKADGEAQLSAWIESKSRGGMDGDGLFEVMRQQNISNLHVPVSYKDKYGRWHKNVCELERNVTSPGGLAVHWKQKRRWWPWPPKRE